MADTMIEADGLVKSYGETRALAGVSFSVPAGTEKLTPARARVSP